MADEVIPFPLQKRQPVDDRALRIVYPGQNGKCRHALHYEVDESSNTVTCRDCGVDLNPIWVLLELQSKESLYLHRYELLTRLQKKINRRVRTLCEHCKRITRIRGL